MHKILTCVLFIVSLTQSLHTNRPCLKYGENCVCMENYCDTLDVPEPKSNSSEFIVITTSSTNIPFAYIRGNFTRAKTEIDPLVTYLEIDSSRPNKQSKVIGFGSTLTEADLATFKQISPQLQDVILNSYFSTKGLKINLLQMPFDQNLDVKQSLQIKDQIQRTLNKQVKVIATLQSTPWMNLNFTENWTTSQLKFMESLTQNEVWSFSLDSTPSAPFNLKQINFLRTHLNGTKNSDAKLTLIDNTENLRNPWIENFDRSAIEKIDMIAVGDNPVAPAPLCRIYKKYQKPILFALKSRSETNVIPKVEPWQAADRLISTLISVLQQNVAGIIDNTLVSYFGKNEAEGSMISINKYRSYFTKTPNYYAMAHFSRYIIPGSMKIDAFFCGPNASVQTVAYLRPDSIISVVLYNSAEKPLEIVLIDKKRGEIRVYLNAKSINTVLYSV